MQKVFPDVLRGFMDQLRFDLVIRGVSRPIRQILSRDYGHVFLHLVCLGLVVGFNPFRVFIFVEYVVERNAKPMLRLVEMAMIKKKNKCVQNGRCKDIRRPKI